MLSSTLARTMIQILCQRRATCVDLSCLSSCSPCKGNACVDLYKWFTTNLSRHEGQQSCHCVCVCMHAVWHILQKISYRITTRMTLAGWKWVHIQICMCTHTRTTSITREVIQDKAQVHKVTITHTNILKHFTF